MERADMSKSFHEYGRGNLAAGTFIAVNGPLISSKLRKEREDKIRQLKKERYEEERERRLCDWRAALEREAARKRQADAERERRARELRERDAARRRQFDERRAELDRREEERRERILAKLNTNRSPSAASSTLAGGDASMGSGAKSRNAAGTPYAFGSSTPRSLTYLTSRVAASAGRGDATDHQTTPTAGVNGSPVRATSTVNLGRRLQSARTLPSNRTMSASVHAVHHTSPPAIKQSFPIRNVLNPRQSSDEKDTSTPYNSVSASKHNTPTTLSSARMTRSFVSPVKNADGKKSAPSTERQRFPRNQLKNLTVFRKGDKSTGQQEMHLTKSRSSDEDGVENSVLEQEDKLKREEQEHQNKLKLQREAELQRRKKQEQERRGAELKKRQEEEEQRQRLIREVELKRMQEEEELHRLREQQEEQERRRHEEEELRLMEEAQVAEQERMRLAVEEEERRRRDEEARREEARRKQIEAETKLREAQERLEREKREAEERAKKEEEERLERKKKLEAIMQRTRNATATMPSTNGQAAPNHTRWSPPSSAMAGADSPTSTSSSTASESRHSMSSAALLQKYMNNRVDTSATRSSVENILAKVRSATALSKSSMPSHNAQLEPSVNRLADQSEHMHNGTRSPAAGTFSLYDADDETADRNSQSVAVSSATTVTQFEVDNSSSASLSRFADLVRRPPAANNI